MSINPYGSGGSAFSIDGIISGMKTGDIISKLIQIESQPILRIQSQKTKIQARDAAYQNIRGKLQTFQGALQALNSATAVNTKSVTVTPPTSTTAILSASATSDAVAGTYQVSVTQLATASTIGTSKPISKGVNTTALLSSAGFNVTPTSGNFTINGVSIAVNPAVDTLSALITRINAAGASVTAAVTNDANGNPNGISLTPAVGTTVQLGSGADTSNFLSAARLVATNVVGGAVSSNAPLSAATPGNALSSQPFNATNPLASSGSFTINGTAINWTSTDTLTNVLNRINSSTAGVKATYDPSADKVTLTNLATGNQAISLTETAPPVGQSGLMAALGLIGANAVSTAGKTAQYTIAANGGAAGPTQYSNTNTVANALPGVTLTLTATGTNNTVVVAQDTGSATRNVQALVDAFNGLTDAIDTSTKYDPATKRGAVLMGDSGIQNLQATLRRMLASPALVPTGSTYTTLQDIGISSGSYGSAPGATNRLVLDSGKLSTALQNNPTAVFQVLSGLAGTATVANSQGAAISTGTSWLQSIAGSPTALAQSGTYRVTYNPTGTPNNLSSVFYPSSGSPQAAVAGSITAGATNSMVTGLTFTAKGTPAAGTEYVKYTVTTSGVLQNVGTFVNSVLASGGMFDAESTSATAQQKTIDKQVASMQARLTQRQATLQKQFTRMEISLQKLQMQGSSLAQKLGTTY